MPGTFESRVRAALEAAQGDLSPGGRLAANVPLADSSNRERNPSPSTQEENIRKESFPGRDPTMQIAYEHHLPFLSGAASSFPGGSLTGSPSVHQEEMKTTPIFSGDLLDANPDLFPSYGLIGERVCDPAAGLSETDQASRAPNVRDPRLFLNTNTPWSAFICGSQGSARNPNSARLPPSSKS
jgi:uncharacterized membrane protein YdfJ with MMPL/SSD domain